MSYSAWERASAFIRAGEVDEALEALAEHLEAQPDDMAARRLRIQVLRYRPADENIDLAWADFEQLGEPLPEDYIDLALLLPPGDALSILRVGLERWPDHEGLTERCVRLMLTQDERESALMLLRSQPASWRWRQLEGDILAAQGDAMLATACYSQALDHLGKLKANPYLEPIKARLHLARAATYRRLGFLDQAGQDYSAAEAMIPDDPVIPFNRGLIAWLLGDVETALELCRPALAQANSRLREEMLHELQEYPRYADLLQELTL